MKRIVVKVGSHVLTEGDHVARERMRSLVDLIVDVHAREIDVILVSSGAVAAGYTQLPIDRDSVPNRQALAAIGQPLLLKMYQEKFADHGMLCSQLLLSADVFESGDYTAHAKNAVDALLANGVIPIINENDTVSIEELVFGDNDRLSAHVAYYFDADLLVLLSDIDAYYDKDPHRYPDAQAKKIVTHIAPEALEDAQSPNGTFATGGIVTKLQSAQFLMERGREMYLASGFALEDVRALLLEGVHRGGTRFVSPNVVEG